MTLTINPATILSAAAASATAGDTYDGAFVHTIRSADADAERAKAEAALGRSDARSVIGGVNRACAMLSLSERRAQRLPGASKRLAKAEERARETLAAYGGPDAE